MNLSGPWSSAYRGRRVLVLGASGFIGRRVVAALAAIGAEVVRAVRPDSPGSAAPGVVAADLSAPGAATSLVEQIQPAVTFNLAGYGVSPMERDPDEAGRLNAALPAELAMACGRARASGWDGLQLVHVGSAAEYGAASGNLSEHSTPHPTTQYGRTKLAGTEAVARASASGKVAAATARLFTVYGPGEGEGRLLPTLLRARGTNGPIPLTAGVQRRDFTCVEDVAAGLLRLGVLTDAQVGTVNLATGVLTPVHEFVRRAAAVLGLASDRLAFGALSSRPGEMNHEPVNIGRLEALTGWRPCLSIEEGVALTLQDPASREG